MQYGDRGYQALYNTTSKKTFPLFMSQVDYLANLKIFSLVFIYLFILPIGEVPAMGWLALLVARA